MHATFMNTLLCFFIVLLGITFLSSASIDNDEYTLADMDWIDYNNYYPLHQLDDRAFQSHFWKRAPHRHFWKRSITESTLNNDNKVKSVSKQIQQQQQNKH